MNATLPLQKPCSPSLIRIPSRPIVTRSSSKPRIDWAVFRAAAESCGNDQIYQRAEIIVLYCKFSRLEVVAEEMDSSNEGSNPSEMTTVTRLFPAKKKTRGVYSLSSGSPTERIIITPSSSNKSQNQIDGVLYMKSGETKRSTTGRHYAHGFYRASNIKDNTGALQHPRLTTPSHHTFFFCFRLHLHRFHP